MSFGDGLSRNVFHYAEIADDHETFVENYKDHELSLHSNEVLRILDSRWITRMILLCDHSLIWNLLNVQCIFNENMIIMSRIVPA